MITSGPVVAPAEPPMSTAAKVSPADATATTAAIGIARFTDSSSVAMRWRLASMLRQVHVALWSVTVGQPVEGANATS
jgi:hypothetical protein